MEGIDSFKIISALDNEDFSDFEDCLLEECAVAVSADYIVTRNTKDFASSRVPAILPDEFLERYKELFDDGSNIVYVNGGYKGEDAIDL